MQNDPNYKIREQFNKIFSQAQETAEKESSLYISMLKLDNLGSDAKIIALYEALKTLKNEIDSFPKPEYIFNHNNKDWLLKVFSNRLVFFEKDESPEITQAFTLAAKNTKIIEKYQKSCEKHPPFDFEKFLASEPNTFFYQLNQRPPKTSFAEYFKCRNWQSTELINTIEAEKLFMQTLFRQASKNDGQLSELLKKEKETLDNLFNCNSNAPANEFVNNLKNLVPFHNSSFKVNEPENWKASFLQVCNGDFEYSKLTPQNIKAIQNTYKTNSLQVPISEPPIIFWSLIKYDDWIDELAKGNISINDDTKYNCDDAYTTAYNNGTRYGEERINEFSGKCNLTLITAEEYKKILLAEFMKLRDRLNELAEPNYFLLLDNTDNLQPYFRHKCYFTGLDEIEIHKLEIAVKLYVEINFFSNELCQLFDNHHFKPTDNETIITRLEIIGLLNAIVLDSELFKRTYHALQQFLNDLDTGYKPFFFIMQDLHERLFELYSSALTRLEKALELQPHPKINYYIQERIKEIRTKEVCAELHGETLGNFTKHFRQFLDVQLDYVKEAKNFTFDPVKALLEHSEPEIPAFSFGYKGKSISTLENIYDYLSLQVDFINTNKTSKQNFITVFTSKDLSKEKTEIHSGCETTQFSYIINHMKSLFSSLTGPNIENSGLFFSKWGNAINKSNLYKSKTDNPKAQEIIDKFFKELK
jgi:hypothetical protein